MIMIKKIILGLFLIGSVIVLWLGWMFYQDFPNPPAIFTTYVAPKRMYNVKTCKVSVSYPAVFNDKQGVQIRAARRMGITPVTENGIKDELSAGRLERVEKNTNLYYHFPAKYSYAYLTPEAKDLLAQIGKMYQKKLGNKYMRLRLTSCLRTEATVRKLRKVNGNAVSNSCHQYGTTFDLSYNFMSGRQKRALASVLQSLRKAGYCYVVYEVRQPCFHITVRK